VLADTEDTWRELFKRSGRQYEDPKLVLFTGSTPTACGTGQSAMGPFYCPSDRKVYIDLSFYQDLQDRFRVPGEFAQAYVIAHGDRPPRAEPTRIADRVRQLQSQGRGEAQANALSVRMELQADCFAGIWAHPRQPHAPDSRTGRRGVGPCRGQRDRRRPAAEAVAWLRRPESFTHGSSEQRVRWFRRGIESGDVRQCDTFGGSI